MENDEIVVTIEHCSNCEEHQSHTQHINDIYKTFARILQKCISTRFPFMRVYLKPIDTDIIPFTANTEKAKKMTIDDCYKEVRIGAMEIQMAIKLNNQVKIIPIHSKLNSGYWPSITNILNKIASSSPTFNFEVQLYDKEEGINVDEEVNEIDELLFTKYENIKVCLYQIKNENINELAQIANNELESILNPKKRSIFLSHTKKLEKESYHSKHEESKRNSRSIIPERSDSLSGIRPFTGKSTYSAINMNNMLSTRTFSAVSYRNSSSRPMSVTSNLNIKTSQYHLGEFLEDKDQIDKFKGKLIKTQYTDKVGKLVLDNLPYDTYLLEIEDSKNFLCCGSIVKFNKLISNISEERTTSPIPVFKKFFGLKRQIYSYVELYIYFNNSTNEDLNLQTISGSEVVLKRNLENMVEKNFFDDTETKTLIKENKKISGRHDILTTPGKHILEVSKSGYDRVIKEVDLTSGLNSITVELNKSKKYKINISVYDWESKEPLDHVNLKLKYSKTDKTDDGLTDENGNFVYDTLNDDFFMTILASKEGFFPCQRTYVKELADSKVSKKQNKTQKEKTTTIEKVWKVGGKEEEIEKYLFIYLVSERFIFESKSSLLVTYSNNLEDNFGQGFLVSKRARDLVKITIEDMQFSKGIISCLIEKKGKNYFNLDEISEIDFNSENEEEECGQVIRLSMVIKSKYLSQLVDVKTSSVPSKHSTQIESCLYSPSGHIFFIPFPNQMREENCSMWDIGFLDIKSDIFYETGVLLNSAPGRLTHFNELVDFLQLIIDHKVYTNLFDLFEFKKGVLHLNDRVLYETAFLRSLKTIQASINEKPYPIFNHFFPEFLIFISGMFKEKNGMISFANFKKKLSSNLKNFKYQIN
jgi:hypothetical protein